jgi:hypothetical protein
LDIISSTNNFSFAAYNFKLLKKPFIGCLEVPTFVKLLFLCKPIRIFRFILISQLSLKNILQIFYEVQEKKLLFLLLITIIFKSYAFFYGIKEIMRVPTTFTRFFLFSFIGRLYYSTGFIFFIIFFDSTPAIYKKIK